VRSTHPAIGEIPVRGLDVVAGYQVTWLLMFADYPRFVRSARGAAHAQDRLSPNRSSPNRLNPMSAPEIGA